MRPDPSPQEQLAELFRQSGWLVMPDPGRRREEGQAYKKGYEIRLPVGNDADLARVRQWLQETGFEVAKPYRKRTGWVQPIYGREAVERFCLLCGYHSET